MSVIIHSPKEQGPIQKKQGGGKTVRTGGKSSKDVFMPDTGQKNV